MQQIGLFGENRSLSVGCGKRFFSVVLALLLVVGVVVPLLAQGPSTVNAQVSTSVPSNMQQYEWTQFGADSEFTFYADGPAPDAPNIKWKAQIPGATGTPMAFNGLVFVQGSGGLTYALDGGTGEIVWKAELSGSIAKFDDTYMLVGSKCVKISDGSVVWTGPPEYSYASSWRQVGFVPELNLVVDNAGKYGWEISDPSEPPTLMWNRTSEILVSEVYTFAYGDGKLFTSWVDGSLVCVDARTGKTLWTTYATNVPIYGGTYLDGKFIHGGLNNNMHCWDANTGELLWTYNPETWYGMWATASGAAYGMIYEHNQDTYLYAINATTGEMVWRAKGPGIGYSGCIVIADGKIYSPMGEYQYRDFETGEYAKPEYNCYDAFTGELLWSLPVETGAATSTHECIAYGNLYLVPTKGTPSIPGYWEYGGGGSLNEVWCISSETEDWSMAYADPTHSSEGAGPTNLAFEWKYQADAPIVSAVTVVDDVAYFGTMAGTVYAVNVNTQAKLWDFKTEYQIHSSLAVVNGKVYTGADDGNVYCLNAATGAKIWETYAGGLLKNPHGGRGFISADNTRSSPIVLGNRVYVGALDGYLYCLNADTGATIWKFQAAPGGGIQATPTIVNNEIYLPANTVKPDGTVYKLDLNGNVIWKKTIPYLLNATTNAGNWLSASATVADGKVFVRNGFRLNYALDASTGDILWTYDGRYNAGTPFQSGGVVQYMPMLYKYGLVYFNDFYGITCLNASTGKEVWYTYLSRENLAAGLSYAYQRIYTVTELGNFYVLDALTGAKISYYEFDPPSQLRSMPVPYDGKIYIGSFDYNLYCFQDARLASTQPAANVQPGSNQVTPATLYTGQTTSQQSSPSITTTTKSAMTIYIVVAVIAVIAIVAIAAVALKRRK